MHRPYRKCRCRSPCCRLTLWNSVPGLLVLAAADALGRRNETAADVRSRSIHCTLGPSSALECAFMNQQRPRVHTTGLCLCLSFPWSDRASHLGVSEHIRRCRVSLSPAPAYPLPPLQPDVCGNPFQVGPGQELTATRVSGF